MSVKKITVMKYSCPGCGKKLGEEWNGGACEFGPKFERCPHCRCIYRTGKRLFSDLTPEELKSRNANIKQTYAILLPIFLISLAVVILTGFELVGVVSFISGFFLIWFSISELNDRTKTLKSISKSDKELYEFEKRESELLKKQHK